MILLSFDTEEFDVPIEYGINYNPISLGMEVSKYGINIILNILKKENVKATFFCTTNFADNAPHEMKRIITEGHELACHGCNHINPQKGDIGRCKERLTEIQSQIAASANIQHTTAIQGWRQPRMFPVEEDELRHNNFTYNSSLNPAFIPGRYMHLTTPRKPFYTEDGILQIPASVTPFIRFPLFWLSMHNLPMCIYERLCKWTWKHDGLFVTYFHPWEFYPLNEHKELGLPFIIRNNAGHDLAERLLRLIHMFKKDRAEFLTFSEFVKKYKNDREGV